MPFTFEPTEIPEVVSIVPRVFPDSRGYFLETFKQSEFDAAGIPGPFLQDNQSRSVRGTVRGLHFQTGDYAQGKLVRCLEGEIWDVAVDIRPGSSTFGKWVARTLTSKGREMLWVPAGFAHGFQVVSEEAEILYKCTTEYAPHAEGGVLWSDPDVALPWPVPEAVVSDKDKILPRLSSLARHAGAGAV